MSISPGERKKRGKERGGKQIAFNSVILFLPNHSSSKRVRLSRFSISYEKVISSRHTLYSGPLFNIKQTRKQTHTHTYPDAIISKFEILKLGQALEPVDPANAVLNKVHIDKVLQVIEAPDMFDLIEAQVKTGELGQVLEALDARYGVVVKVQVRKGRAQGVERFYGADAVLSKT